jgi:hypothetical protein
VGDRDVRVRFGRLYWTTVALIGANVVVIAWTRLALPPGTGPFGDRDALLTAEFIFLAVLVLATVHWTLLVLSVSAAKSGWQLWYLLVAVGSVVAFVSFFGLVCNSQFP